HITSADMSDEARAMRLQLIKFHRDQLCAGFDLEMPVVQQVPGRLREGKHLHPALDAPGGANSAHHDMGGGMPGFTGACAALPHVVRTSLRQQRWRWQPAA